MTNGMAMGEQVAIRSAFNREGLVPYGPGSHGVGDGEIWA